MLHMHTWYTIDFITSVVHAMMAAVCRRIMDWLRVLWVWRRMSCLVRGGLMLIRSRRPLRRQGRRMMTDIRAVLLTVWSWRREVIGTAARCRTHRWSGEVLAVVLSRIGVRVGKRTSRVVTVVVQRRSILGLLHLHAVVRIRFTIQSFGAGSAVVVFVDFPMDHRIGGVGVSIWRRIVNLWRLGPRVRGIGRKVDCLWMMLRPDLRGKMWGMLMMVVMVLHGV